MFAPSANRHQRLLNKADLGVAALLAVFTILVRLPWIGDPNADFDEQLYSLIGNAMLTGQLPFVDLWDRKPFGLFALFAAAHAIGGPGPVAYQMFAAIFTLIGALLTYILAREQSDDRQTAAAAGMLYSLLMAIYGVFSANSEAFFVPMMVAMAALVHNPAHPNAVGRAIVAMLIGGLALQVKYTALPQCLFFGLWALWGQFRLGMTISRLIALAIGFAVCGVLPTVAVGVGYALAGHWDAFWFANFVSFFDRLPSPSGRFRSDYLAFMVLLPALSLGGLIGISRSGLGRLTSMQAFLSLWFVASLATVFLPATLYVYYLAAMIPPCVLLGLPLFQSQPGARWNIRALIPGLYLLIVPVQLGLSLENRAETERLANAIAPLINAREGRCLYVFDGPASLYQLTQSCLPTRFIYPDHLNNALERDALGVSQEEEVANILAQRPPVIVTSDDPVTQQNEATNRLIRDAITRDYRALHQETLQKRVIRAWALRE